MTTRDIIHRAIGHAIFKHDLNITDDPFIIHSSELNQMCDEAADEIAKDNS